MDNATIILHERLKLMKEGKIGSTGRILEFTAEDGTTKKIPEPEPLLTYDVWKHNGFIVKRGEHAAAVIEIWMPRRKKTSDKKKTAEKTDDSSASTDKTEISPEKQGFYKKRAFFFRMCQVEKQNTGEGKR
ncbi:hypothetical protein ACTQZS_14100 [Bilifractor sp. LCP19S3_H10]|uniref:hypothetical protein n=1 Tax=Bilifractor sp. LCP19S3_H10 TaxID=3438736 RepID=UPI003F8E5957